ncbi:MAG: type II toxin-antitoxin system VapC family toxin [Candidatus Anammoxibacter sp.]
MIFDTDILIFVQRGNEKAANLIEKESERFISIQTYMELLQNAENKKQHEYTKEFIKVFSFQVLPLTENIGHRALIYIEEYTLSSNLSAPDAIIAATSVENNITLSTSNQKHFKPIKELKLQIFKP